MAQIWARAAERTNSPKVDFSQSYDTSKLKGRSALITGGATGIGGGFVAGLAEAGAYVTIADLNETDAVKLVEELTGKGLHAQFIKTDVLSWASLVAAFKAAIAFSPSNTIDIVVPNAGVAGGGMYYWLTNTPLDPETKDPQQPPQHVVGVNFMGVYNTVHAAMYYFKNFPGGDDKSHSKLIVLVSSMGGYQAMPTVLDYNSSKWGVRGLFWSLRNLDNVLGEGKPGFRVNLIAPTWVRTNMTKGFSSRVAADSPVKIAEVSDCVDVFMRMSADEGLKGRAAAIAADKLSFDLCDDPEGKSGGNILSDPEYMKFFGYGPLATKPAASKTEETPAEAPQPLVDAPATAAVPPQSTAVEIPASG